MFIVLKFQKLLHIINQNKKRRKNNYCNNHKYQKKNNNANKKRSIPEYVLKLLKIPFRDRKTRKKTHKPTIETIQVQ